LSFPDDPDWDGGTQLEWCGDGAGSGDLASGTQQVSVLGSSPDDTEVHDSHAMQWLLQPSQPHLAIPSLSWAKEDAWQFRMPHKVILKDTTNRPKSDRGKRTDYPQPVSTDDPCFPKQMTSLTITQKAWDAMKQKAQQQVYRKAGDHSARERIRFIQQFNRAAEEQLVDLNRV
jgi:hypothetical protein